MKKLVISVLTAALGSASCGGYEHDDMAGAEMAASSGAIVIEDTFDVDAEGWQVVLFNQWSATAVAAQHEDGELLVRDYSDGDTFYWMAPSAYLGNQSAMYGGSLEFTVRSTGTAPAEGSSQGIQVATPDWGITLYYPLAAPTLENSDYVVPFTVGQWWHSSGRLATAQELAKVLGNLGTLRITAEWRTQNDVGFMDRVALRAP